MSKAPEEPKAGRFATVKTAFNYVKDSAPVKIVTGSAVVRSIGVVTVLASAAVATVPATVIGIGSIAIGAAMDTADTRNLRLLKKENSLLTKNRKAQNQQNELLESQPLLAEVLKDKLYVPSRSDQNSLTDRYIDTAPQSSVNISSYGKALVKNSIDVIKNGYGAIVTPSLGSIGKVGKSAYGLYGESKKQATKEEIGLQFKQSIDQERSKPDTPGYNDLTELAEATRAQRVQTLALKKMVDSGSFHNATPEEIVANFEAAKQEVLKTEKAIVDTRGVVGTVKSYAKDFGLAHNPFSKYNNLDQLKSNPEQEPIKKPDPDIVPKQSSTKVLQSDKAKNRKTAVNIAKEVQAKLKNSEKPKHKKRRHHPKKKHRNSAHHL